MLSSPPKVAVVGGSLGGLFDALALQSLGCEVDVYEKSSGLMHDRGAGIVFQYEVADFLTRYDVTPVGDVVVPVRTRRYLNADGSVAQDGPMPQLMTSWDALYRKLRAAFGDDRYHVGARLAPRPGPPRPAAAVCAARGSDGRAVRADHT